MNAKEQERKRVQSEFQFVKIATFTDEDTATTFEFLLYNNDLPYKREALSFYMPGKYETVAKTMVDAYEKGTFLPYESVDEEEPGSWVQQYTPRITKAKGLPVGLYVRFLIILLILLGLLRMLFTMGFLEL